MPLPSIPDHDGRPIADLRPTLAEIARLYRNDPRYRVLTAAAAYEHMDLMALHRELQVGLAEFADERGVSRIEALRLVMPAGSRALHDAIRRFRFGS